MRPLRLVPAPSPARATDAELIEAILTGDGGAAETLFRRHHTMVTGLAFRLLGGDADVDDVAQDAFIEALRALPTLTNPQAFASWIASIVVRIVGKRLRRRRLLERLGLRRPTPVDVDAFLSAACPGDIAAELRAVYRVVGALSEETRVALILRRVEGLTLEETAAHMNLSTATVKRRMTEAEGALAKMNRSGRGSEATPEAQVHARAERSEGRGLKGAASFVEDEVLAKPASKGRPAERGRSDDR